MTKSLALLFPGQGSQYVGMGKSLENDPSFSLFETVNKKLGHSLSSIMFEGPLETLTLTQNAQPAIVSYSYALFQKLSPLLASKDISIDYCLGHSVGEYSALAAAGVLSLSDAAYAVSKRGEFMQNAVPAGVGTMIAVMKVAPEQIEKACADATNENEKVAPANFNEPGQTVISGHREACLRAVKWLEENIETPFRTVELQVSAPFHSSLMQPAATQLTEVLGQINFSPLKYPYIANINAQKYDCDTGAGTIKKNLIEQVDGSVRWSQSMASLPDDTLCIEVGPGRVLMGLARKINRNLKVISLDKEGAFEELEELLS